jgi:prepilin-type N-terminal cleavage/methylation domain-containing protein
MFNNQWAKSLTQKFSQVQASDIQDGELKSKFLKLKAAKQAGFTLLELLVVVAILAAIAGTASIALQDTDARASAAAHVTMMDELNKGIRTFRVLNKNVLPSNFDSLISTVAAIDGSTDAARLSASALDAGSIQLLDLQADAAEILNGGGIDGLRYVNIDATFNPADAGDCSDVEALIASRGNAVVPGNIFMSPTANGCGYTFAIDDQDGAIEGFQFTSLPKVAVWVGGYERVMGAAGQGFDATALATDGSALTAGVVDAPILMAVGLGPSSNLFNANDLGGMTTVPVYRHVSGVEYNRFTALFNIGTVTSATTWESTDQVSLTAIVDGAGDTKEEELGEWDGTRNTI